jgi:AcrR family transcriptional regulator
MTATDTHSARSAGRLAPLWDDGFGEVARRLLTSGVCCFADVGFHATTTRDITRAAGLSSAALYVHFPSKEHLLFEIARAAHTDSLESLRSAPPAEHAAARLEELVTRFVTWHARHHVAARVSQHELAALSAEHYRVIVEIRRQTTEVFRTTVEWGIRDGLFAHTDVMRLVRAIMSLGIDLVRWYDLGGPDTPEELGTFYAHLALAMVHSVAA